MNHIEYARKMLDSATASKVTLEKIGVRGRMLDESREAMTLWRDMVADLELAQLVRRHMVEQGITFGWDDGTVTIEGIHGTDGKTDYIRLADNFDDLDAAVQYAAIHPATKEKR